MRGAHIRDTVVWLCICVTVLGLGAMYLTGFVHNSDNKLRTVQITEVK